MVSGKVHPGQHFAEYFPLGAMEPVLTKSRHSVLCIISRLVVLIAMGVALNNMCTGSIVMSPRTWEAETESSLTCLNVWEKTDEHILSKLEGGKKECEAFANKAKNSVILIPKSIHQTYSTREVPDEIQKHMDTWVTRNPGWVVKFYDDTQCLEMVQREFPEYLDAYQSLPENVERADFFRYMVVLRYGGVYADIDTESRMSIESVIGPEDSLVVGWESDFATGLEASEATYVRVRQVLQWVFAATPGHPALRDLCDMVAAHARDPMFDNTNEATLEKAGPGIFTDVILRHVVKREEGIRILPKIAFGAHPQGEDVLSQNSHQIVVLHHYLNSWKKKEVKENFVMKSLHWFMQKTPKKIPELAGDVGSLLFPVSFPWYPKFVIMVHLKGQGERIGDNDFGSVIFNWGNLQGGVAEAQYPTVVDVLVGCHRPDVDKVFVDIAAGLGYFSLAAAAYGHRTIAFETLPKNLDAFMESIEYNQFGSVINIHKVELGTLSSGFQCRTPKSDTIGMRPCSLKETALEEQKKTFPKKKNVYKRQEITDSIQNNTSCVCHTSLAEYLPRDLGIRALRIGFNHNVRWLTREGIDIIAEHLPKVIMVEFAPKVAQKSMYMHSAQFLWALRHLGYAVFHSGHVCKLKWSRTVQQI